MERPHHVRERNQRPGARGGSFDVRCEVRVRLHRLTGDSSRWKDNIQAPAAGYVVHCSGHCDGDGGKPGIPGVGLAVRESIVRALGPDDIVPEHISARLLKVRVIFKYRTATTFIVGYAPTETAATCHKSKLWKELRSTVAEVPASDHLILMMDANARTGERGKGGGLGGVRVWDHTAETLSMTTGLDF